MSTQEYTLSREEAARRLNISIRTLDRYIRRNYFDAKKVDHHIWISKPSFERYYQDYLDRTQAATGSTEDSIDSPSEIPEVTSTIVESLPSQAPRISLSSHEHSYESDLHPATIYKNLYEDIKPKYEEQQKRLEGAHYRVGQLEAQLKSMVPLLELKKERQQVLLLERQHKETVNKASGHITRLKTLFQRERLNKNVYLALVYLLLALHIVFWGIAKI